MLLMVLVESQAVLRLLSFSPSVAALCSGTPDPPLALLVGPPAGPGSGWAQARSQFRWGRVGLLLSMGAWRSGPGPGRAKARLALREVSTADQGGAAEGPPDFGIPSSARSVFTLTGFFVVVSACVVCLSYRCAGLWSLEGG
jgi:hypothetical protein